MAITVGTITTDKSTSVGATRTFSHTCSANRIVVLVALRGSASNPSGISVTYNGVSATSISNTNVLGSNRVRVECFYLNSPAQGANDVVVSWSANSNWVITVMDINGSDTSIAPSNGANTTVNSTSASINVTSDTSSMVFDLIAANSGATLTEDASQTATFSNQSSSSGSSDLTAGGSRETGAATTTMSWTRSSSGVMCLCGFSIKEASTSVAQAVWFS